MFSSVLIDVLKSNFPFAELYFICNGRTYEVLEKCPDLEKIFIFEKGHYKGLWRKSKAGAVKKFLSFLGQIKKERFDLAIDLSMGSQYSFFLMLLGVPERIGFNYKNRGRFLTKKLEFDGFNEKAIPEYHLDVARLLDLKIESPSTRICLDKMDEEYIDEFFKRSGVEKKLIFSITPGGGVSFGKEKISFKRWDEENFSRLIDMLMGELNGEVILIWGPGEEDLIKKINRRTKNKPITAPPTTIRQMAALMKRSSVVICNDSGPLHVAAAVGARTVSVFGPSDETVYGAYPPSGKHLIVTKDIDCRPCYKKFRLPECEGRACLRGVDPKNVFLAVKKHENL